MINSKFLILGLISILFVVAACKKSSTDFTPTPIPPPYLTERTWVLDTITINPPADFNSLTSDEKLSYQIALGWSKSAELNFHLDQSVTTGGNWNFGYNSWRLINGKTDIETTSSQGRDTLQSFVADTLHFTYIHKVGGSVNCTLIFK